jgi:hypothetical protein
MGAGFSKDFTDDTLTVKIYVALFNRTMGGENLGWWVRTVAQYCSNSFQNLVGIASGTFRFMLDGYFVVCDEWKNN